MINYRYLGNSGLKITELTYGNWITHGSQVENDAAAACVKAALDVGISSFDTADVYANTKAETVLGDILKGERRESLEIFTKVYWPTGPGGPNDSGLSPQAHHGVDQRLADATADRLRRPLPGPPLRHRDAARGDDAGLRRRGAPGQGALHRRQRVDRRPDSRGRRHGQGPGLPAHLVPAPVLDAVARDRGRGRARIQGSRASARSCGPPWPRACSPASTSPARPRPPARAPPTRTAARTSSPVAVETTSS